MIPALGWLATALLLIAAACSAWRAAREKALGPLAASLALASFATIPLAVLGALSPLRAGLLVLLAAGGAAVVTLLQKETIGDLLGHLAESLGLPFGYARRAARWGRSQGPSFAGRARGGAEAGEIPLEAVADYAASRAIPSLMEDAALGAPAEPAAIAQAGIPVPVPWAQLAAWIRDREPSDDTELRMFHEGDAAGALAVADARHAYGEMLLNAVGLSPAYVAGELEAADSMAEHASLLTQVGRRFGVIYGALQEWVAAHGHLPHKGDFLTGEE
jgi:hypothetical protein